MSTPYAIFALYHFCDLDNLPHWQEKLLSFGHAHDIKGTLLLAHEGINGTVSGPRDSLLALIQLLKEHPPLASLTYKESSFIKQPFLRLKVKIKKEIVSIGCDTNPAQVRGQYVSPVEWNEILKDPSIPVIDTRNDYEYAIGTFKNAINPQTTHFRQFPNYIKENFDPNKHKKVAMFCTGGIRCEKASSHMLLEGFETVYHLEGGILKYLEEIPEQESMWEGECFVFDQRIAVTHGLKKGQYDQCHACRWPITEQDKDHPDYVVGVSCARCIQRTSSEKKASLSERQKQIHLAKNHGKSHLGQIIKKKKTTLIE